MAGINNSSLTHHRKTAGKNQLIINSS